VLHLPSDCFIAVEVDIPPQMVVLARVTRCGVNEREVGVGGFEFGWIEVEGGELCFFVAWLLTGVHNGGSMLVI